MKQNSTVYLTYALDKEGKLVHIDDVPNGDECNCFCPHCKSHLCAKNGGKIKTHHFAHLSGADCKSAVESALHIMAKDILSKHKRIMLPPISEIEQAKSIEFTEVELEKTSDFGLRPDCECYYGKESEKRIWIEFKRTHAVDQKKKGKIISAKIDCIEIDINSCKLNPEEVKRFLTEVHEKRVWIYNKEYTYSENKERDHHYTSHYSYRTCPDDVYHKVPIHRTFAKEETGNIVNLKSNDNIDTNKHNYYCLACGKEVTLENIGGVYSFIHLNENNNDFCEYEQYLHKSAKAIIYDKFQKSEKFEIEINHPHVCSRKDCKLFIKELCIEWLPQRHNLKSLRYNKCTIDAELPNTDKRADLLLSHKENPQNDIIINLSYNSNDLDSLHIRRIDLIINNEKDLENLINNPLKGRCFNFDANERTAEISSYISRFELFGTGRCYNEIVNCKDIGKASEKKSTVLTIYFKGQYEYTYTENLGLFHCLNENLTACYCNLCTHLRKYGREYICKIYKTKGTPHYPLEPKNKPINCQFFELNEDLKHEIEEDEAYINRRVIFPVENLTNP